MGKPLVVLHVGDMFLVLDIAKPPAEDGHPVTVAHNRRILVESTEPTAEFALTNVISYLWIPAYKSPSSPGSMR